TPGTKFRIRLKNDQYTLTKKTVTSENTFSSHNEENIILSEEEYNLFSTLPSRSITKKRYNFLYEGLNYEFDVFLGDLKGLVLVEVEFENKDALDAFRKPDFCLIDVTEDEFIS